MIHCQKVENVLNRPLHYHNYNNRVLLILFLTITVHLCSAFTTLIGTQLHTASAMSTDNSCAKNKELHLSSESKNSIESQETNNNDSLDDPLLLPESNSNDPSIPKIQLGETISFEEMGPVIINMDGTTRRIDNWDKMTKQEQEVAWRRISKRNTERRAALLAKQNMQEEN